MNRSQLAISVAVLLLTCGCADSRPIGDMMLASAEELIESWTASWNSYDLDVVDEQFLTDQRLTYFSSEKEGVIRGKAAVLEHHVGFGFVAGGKEQENRLWLEDVGYDVFDTSVVVTGIWFFARAGETTPPQKGPVTFTLIWHDGRLQITHCNFSEYVPEPDVD
ncbi:YybH family protein [Gemmatimonadota bacterium]